MQRIDYRMATTNCWRTVKRLDSGETADDFSHAHNQRTPDSEYAVNRAINSHMEKSVRWVLFEYQGLELVILSKPFKTKKLAEKARQKYPDSVQRKIGIGVIRVPNQ
jgi:hypothetical protein